MAGFIDKIKADNADKVAKSDKGGNVTVRFDAAAYNALRQLSSDISTPISTVVREIVTNVLTTEGELDGKKGGK